MCQGSGYSSSSDEAVDGLVDNFARGVTYLEVTVKEGPIMFSVQVQEVKVCVLEGT